MQAQAGGRTHAHKNTHAHAHPYAPGQLELPQGAKAGGILWRLSRAEQALRGGAYGRECNRILLRAEDPEHLRNQPCIGALLRGNSTATGRHLTRLRDQGRGSARVWQGAMPQP